MKNLPDESTEAEEQRREGLVRSTEEPRRSTTEEPAEVSCGAPKH
jgi:hypothetical protein